MKTTLLIPTYNEIDGMKAIMPRVKSEWVDEILVVDRGTDGTDDYAREHGYRVIKQNSKGLYGAYLEGLAACTGDVVITFSPDGNSIPEIIPELVKKMKEGYDMVIVSRYAHGAHSDDDDALTSFGNRLFTKTINIVFNHSYTDTLVMFRAWRKDLAKYFKYNAGRASVETYTSILCAKMKLKTCDIPGIEPPRVGGQRKMNPLLNGMSIMRLILLEYTRGPVSANKQ